MRWRMRRRDGQSTVEYALVLMAFIATVLALGALWRVVHDGRALRWAEEATSHSMEGGFGVGLLQDVLSY